MSIIQKSFLASFLEYFLLKFLDDCQYSRSHLSPAYIGRQSQWQPSGSSTSILQAPPFRQGFFGKQATKDTAERQLFCTVSRYRDTKALCPHLMRTISKTYVFMTEGQHSPLVFAIDNVQLSLICDLSFTSQVLCYLWYIMWKPTTCQKNVFQSQIQTCNYKIIFFGKFNSNTAHLSNPTAVRTLL